MSEPGEWTPPFRPWAAQTYEPMCSMTVNGPHQPVIAAIAGESRRTKLRAKVAPDGRSVTVKSSIRANLALVLSQTELFSPALTVAIADEGPWGTRYTLTVRGGSSYWVAPAMSEALNRAAWALAHSGMTVVAEPWEGRLAGVKRKSDMKKQARRAEERQGER